MRRLLIPACLCLVSVGATTIGPPAPWPIEPIATSTHAKSKTKTKSSKSKPRRKTTAVAKAAPKPPAEAAASFAERLAPFAAALNAPPTLKTPPANTLQTMAYAAEAAIEVPAALVPMSPPPGTPPSVLKRVVYRSQNDICDTLAKAAHSNNLPVPFFIRLLFQESRFNAASVSHAGAQGIAQFMPETAAEVGLDNPFDPLEAIPAAARLLRDLADRFGNLGLAAAAYNAGPTRVQKWLKRQGALPAETRGYVRIITGKPAERWKTATGGHGETEVPQKAPCKEHSVRYAANNALLVPLPQARAQEHGKAAASAGAQARLNRTTVLQLAARRR